FGSVTSCIASTGDGGFASAPVYIDSAFAGCLSYLGEPVAWYDADDDGGIILDAGRVVMWRDRSTRGNDLTVFPTGYNPVAYGRGRLNNNAPGFYFQNGVNGGLGATGMQKVNPAGLPLVSAP